MALDPALARKVHRTLEPIHGFVYFSPDAEPAYTAVGLRPGRMGYFASRSAAMGAVAADVVIATFFNFEHGLVRSVIPDAWSLASPRSVLDARLSVADAGLRRWVDVTAPELAEAASLARAAAERACEHPEGRPLFAGHASLDWPPADEPHLVLWHAQTLLREHRGDAHVAALCLAGLTGIEALVCHAASGEVGAEVLRTTRAHTDEAWAAAVDGLAARGLVHADGSFTDAGAAQRAEIERVTDERSIDPYEAIGEDGIERLRTLARPFAKAIVAAAFG